MSSQHIGGSAEVVIVGGGLIGMSVALQLARLGCRDVVVLERGRVGDGSSGRGVGGFRQQFDTAINVQLSQLSLPTLLELGDQIELQQQGYLYLALSEVSLARITARANRQRSWGVPVELLAPEEIARRWPFLSLSDVVGAAFCGLDGYARPPLALAAYRREAQALGVRVVEGAEVVAVECEPSTGGIGGERRIAAVKTAAGRIATPWMVDAAGPQAAAVAALVGVKLPVLPLKRQVFTTTPWAANNPPPYDGAPLTIDEDSGFHFRPDGNALTLALSGGEQLGVEELGLDPALGEQALRYGKHRLPALHDSSIAGARAGFYEMTPDAHPVLGPVPEVVGLVCACGFSGHGFMHSPAAGLLLAELITTGRSRSLDIAPLAITRFATGELLGTGSTL